jgi:putative ABC transport system permease protein
MPFFAKAKTFLRNLLLSRHVESDLNEEVHSHLAMLTEENVRAGMSSEEAQRAARIEFGGVEQVKEQVREQRLDNWFYSLYSDCRYGLRQLRKNPGFTTIAVLALGLGIGATTAVFSVVDRILFRSLPYPKDERLVSFGVKAPFEGIEFMLAPEYLVLRSQPSPFESMTSLTPSGDDCDVTEGNPAHLNCTLVEANFLSTFGIHPVLGRDFSRKDDRPSAPRVAIVTYGLWQSRFAGDPKIAGRLMSVDGNSVEIIGVLPANFEMPTLNPVDILLPQALDEAAQDRTHPQVILRAFARLKPTVSIAQATAALQPWFQDSLNFVPPQFRAEVSLRVRSLRDRQMENSRAGAWVLFGAVIAVLLLACTNVANLLLVRAISRKRELAVRAALGASRPRLARQTLTESLLLCSLGGIAGCGLAYLFLRLFIAIAPQGIVLLHQASLDFRVLGFCVAVSLLSGISFGVAPALSNPAPESLVGRTARTTARGFMRHTLVAAQISGSLMLLTGAGLLLRSLWKIQTVPLGLEARHSITAQISLAEHRYSELPQQLAFFRELESRLSRLPGVEDLALSNSLPPSGSMQATFYSAIEVAGRPPVANGTGGMVGFRMVTPNYFPALGIHIVRGRPFTEEDRAPTDHPVILSETLAARMFPNQDPLGKMMRFSRLDSHGPWRTIVGIAANVKNNGLTAEADPEFYIPWKDDPEASVRHAFVTFRTSLSPETAVPLVRGEIGGLDATAPVEFATMNTRIGKLTAGPRFDATLLSIFAAIGMLLAAIGLYGVVSFFVSQRTQEIGVRMALGANPRNIAKLVLLNVARWTAAGAAVGLLGSWFAARLLQSLLFQVPVHDPILLAAALLLLLVVALFAAWLPARRATRFDPMIALRHE